MKKKFLFLLSIGLLTSCGNINVNNNNSSSLVNNVIDDSEVSTSSLESIKSSLSLINNENNSISDKAVSNMELIDFKGDLESLYVNFK